MMELESLPVVWKARLRCMQYWYKVMTSSIYYHYHYHYHYQPKAGMNGGPIYDIYNTRAALSPMLLITGKSSLDPSMAYQILYTVQVAKYKP